MKVNDLVFPQMLSNESLATGSQHFISVFVLIMHSPRFIGLHEWLNASRAQGATEYAKSMIWHL